MNKRIGRPKRDITYSETLNIKMTNETIVRLRAMLQKKGMTLSAYIRALIIEKLNEFESGELNAKA